MNGPSDLLVMRAAAALDVYSRNLVQAAHWVHPSWTAALIGVNDLQLDDWCAALSRAGAPLQEACSRALVSAVGVKLPCLDVLLKFVQEFALPTVGGGSTSRDVSCISGVSLLDFLPIERGLQVLRMRALSIRRVEVRRLIDKRTRWQLSGWVGVGIERLLKDNHFADAADLAHFSARSDVPPLAMLDANALAVEGCELLVRDLGMTNTGSTRNHMPFPLLRLALPRVLPIPEWIYSLPAGFDALGTERLFMRLPELLPESSWLFG